jgi:hypothetical protein
MIARGMESLSPDDEGGEGTRGCPAKKSCENKNCGVRCYEITSSMKNRIIEYRVVLVVSLCFTVETREKAR